jgi:dolichyl-phosphate-mannose--protein O-mannosyl transferase
VLFIIFAFFFMLRFMQLDLRTEKPLRVLRNLAGSGLFMGLAIASKWIGIYAGLGLAVLFFWHCVRMLKMGWKLKQMLILCLWCVGFFILVPLVIYLLSYIPYMAYNHRIKDLGGYLKAVWDAQVGMLNYHSTPGLGMDHPYYSPWWEWPIIGKPMWYYSEAFIDESAKMHTVIFCFGNPVIWFGSLGTLAICLFRWIAGKRYRLETGGPLWHWNLHTFDVRYAFLFLGLLAQYLPWVLVPRGTYIYHYFASVPFLILSMGLALDGWGDKARKWMYIAGWVIGIAALVFFIILFPYASGMPCPEGWMNIGKGLLKIWY